MYILPSITMFTGPIYDRLVMGVIQRNCPTLNSDDVGFDGGNDKVVEAGESRTE